MNLPISSYAAAFTTLYTIAGKTITTNLLTASLPLLAGGAYMMRIVISKNTSDNRDEVRIRIKSDRSYSTTVSFDFLRSQAFLVRDRNRTATARMPEAPKRAYSTVRTAPVPKTSNSVTLSIYVDRNSVELFVNDRVAALSGLIYPNSGAEMIQAVSGSGRLTLDSFVYAAAK